MLTLACVLRGICRIIFNNKFDITANASCTCTHDGKVPVSAREEVHVLCHMRGGDDVSFVQPSPRPVPASLRLRNLQQTSSAQAAVRRVPPRTRHSAKDSRPVWSCPAMRAPREVVRFECDAGVYRAPISPPHRAEDAVVERTLLARDDLGYHSLGSYQTSANTAAWWGGQQLVFGRRHAQYYALHEYSAAPPYHQLMEEMLVGCRR